jgi:hypothetical protein
MSRKFVYVITPILLILSACAPSVGPAPDAEEMISSTPTPTETTGAAEILTPASRCAGVEGTFELRMLVGPSEAAGLEPVAVGSIPFSVTSAEAPYTLAGESPITYEETLEAVWGTYSVFFDMDVVAAGSCDGEDGSEKLMTVIDMTGDQVVEVQAEGFQGEYPWSGTHHLDLAFPLIEGAEASGEGWQIILHLIS